MNHDDDKANVLLSLAVSAESPPGPCPDEGALAAFADGSLARNEAARVERHVAHCDRCYAIWRGGAELEATPAAAAAPRGTWPRLLDRLAAAGRRRSLLAGATAVLVGAVVLGVALNTTRIGGPALPGYSLTLEGRTQYLRDRSEAPGPDAVAVFESGNQFRLILAPDTAVDRPVSAQVLAARGGEAPAPLATPAARVTAKGAIRIDGVVGASVPLEPGPATLYVIVAFDGRAPAADGVLRRLRNRSSATGPSWQAWKIPVEIRPPAVPM